MKLRLLPIGISLIVSLAVLFGGWFLYDSYAMETPLNQVVKETPGVENATVDIDKDNVTIHFTPASGANLRDIYASITERGASVISGRAVKLDAKTSSSPELEAWWAHALFDVAQAMETKQYGDIPVRLEALKSTAAGLTVQTEMDEHSVYITMKDKLDNSKYVILPRQAQKMGVWPNE